METQHLHTVVQGKTSIRNRHSAKIQIMHVRHVAPSVNDVNKNDDKITRSSKLIACDLFFFFLYVRDYAIQCECYFPYFDVV